MATLKDVADKAGVSIATVSRYLNNDIQIRMDTQNRIDEAIKELNYRKSSKLMKRFRHTNSIAVVVPRISYSKFSAIVENMINIVKEEGYTVITFIQNNDASNETEIVEEIINLRVNGAVLITEPKGQDQNDNCRRLEEAGIPVVTIVRNFGPCKYPSVCTDYYNMLKDVLYHFYSNGIQNVGFMLGWREQDGTKYLLKAIEDVKEELDINFPLMQNIYYTDYNTSKFELGLEFLMNKGIQGLFTIDDTITIGVIKAMRRRGLSYPKDLAIVSTTDNHTLSLMGVSAVDTDARGLSREAFHILHKKMNGLEHDQFVQVPYHLRQRESSMIQNYGVKNYG